MMENKEIVKRIESIQNKAWEKKSASAYAKELFEGIDGFRMELIESSGSLHPVIDRRIIKSGGHCYNGTGWEGCGFWNYNGGIHRCMLFGCTCGILKSKSKSLNICDKIYGENYEGKP